MKLMYKWTHIYTGCSGIECIEVPTNDKRTLQQILCDFLNLMGGCEIFTYTPISIERISKQKKKVSIGRVAA
jgi:hypothetical protein